MWIDSHAHPQLDERLGPGALARAFESDVVGVVCVGCDRTSSLAATELAVSRDRVWATVGLHPHEAKFGVDTIADIAIDSTYGWVGVGECGLDYYYDHSDRDVQRQVFAQQIALASQLDLALIIHSRDAWDDTFAVLAEVGVPRRTLFHCFTGGVTEAERALAIGASLSFSGIVTFKTALDVQAAAAMVPLDRVLVETDAPYLAPVPHRGKTNEPSYVGFVGAAVAKLRNQDVDEFAAATVANTVAMFGLDTTLSPTDAGTQ
jgi:TatD DNase family protein